jgi:hypothetical protein
VSQKLPEGHQRPQLSYGATAVPPIHQTSLIKKAQLRDPKPRPSVLPGPGRGLSGSRPVGLGALPAAAPLGAWGARGRWGGWGHRGPRARGGTGALACLQIPTLPHAPGHKRPTAGGDRRAGEADHTKSFSSALRQPGRRREVSDSPRTVSSGFSDSRD